MFLHPSIQKKAKGAFILSSEAFKIIFGEGEQAAIAALADMAPDSYTPADIAANPALLAEVEILFSGWGGPKLTSEFLNYAPKLRAVFYASGSVATIITDAVWERGITISSAREANAIPTAEYALSVILFSLKHGWRLMRALQRDRAYPAPSSPPGAFHSTVGLISVGSIGRKLAELLMPFDLHVRAYDPFLSAELAATLAITPATLRQIFAESDVVSIHAPWLPETSGLVTGDLIRSMRQGATLINSSRGAIVRETELIDVAHERPDLQFVLDVTYPEPPASNSPLFDLPNVVLTPHIAGSMGPECHRMAQAMIEELKRYLAGEPLKWAIRSEALANSSHHPL